MFTTLKLFFTSDLGKGVALVALVALGATAVYASGRAAGQVAGYNKGYTEGKNSRQPEVNHLQENVAALTATINNERQATATKVQTLQTNAANAAVATEQNFNKKLRERDQVISNYASKVPPQVQESC